MSLWFLKQRSWCKDYWVLHEISFAQKISDLFAQCANSVQTIRLFCTDLWLPQHAQHAHNIRTTCEEVPDNECSLYFNKFKIGVLVLFHRSPCHSWQLQPSQLNLASDKNPWNFDWSEEQLTCQWVHDEDVFSFRPRLISHKNSFVPQNFEHSELLVGTEIANLELLMIKVLWNEWIFVRN